VMKLLRQVDRRLYHDLKIPHITYGTLRIGANHHRDT
jgi:hypothetical protein